MVLIYANVPIPQANNNMSAEFLPNKPWTIPVLYIPIVSTGHSPLSMSRNEADRLPHQVDISAPAMVYPQLHTYPMGQ